MTVPRTPWRLPPFFFVFDVETVGLQGEPFAVGWVVVDTSTGAEVDNGILVQSFERAAKCVTPGGGSATEEDIRWVTDHVLPTLAAVTPVDIVGHAPTNIRRPFWTAWNHWSAQGALLAADVPWPCEARFLMQCVRYTFWNGNTPQLQSGPYPLIDIASVRLAKGFDPIATVVRLETEEPAHNPLNDARQSARLLLEALRA